MDRKFLVQIVIPDAKDKGTRFKSNMPPGVLLEQVYNYKGDDIPAKDDLRNARLLRCVHQEAADLLKETVTYTVIEVEVDTESNPEKQET